MSNGLNKIMVIGNLARDAELANVGEKNTPRAKFRLLTTTGFGDREHTEGFNCVLWGKRAESVAQYLTKGKRLYVEGELRSRSFEQDGQKRYFTDVLVKDLTFQPQKGRGDPKAEPGGATEGGGEEMPF